MLCGRFLILRIIGNEGRSSWPILIVKQFEREPKTLRRTAEFYAICKNLYSSLGVRRQIYTKYRDYQNHVTHSFSQDFSNQSKVWQPNMGNSLENIVLNCTLEFLGRLREFEYIPNHQKMQHIPLLKFCQNLFRCMLLST